MKSANRNHEILATLYFSWRKLGIVPSKGSALLRSSFYLTSISSRIELERFEIKEIDGFV